jgi:hypothetical protein
MLLWTHLARGRSDTIINLAGGVRASLGIYGSARHDPLANSGWTGTVLNRTKPSRARVGPARPI